MISCMDNEVNNCFKSFRKFMVRFKVDPGPEHFPDCSIYYFYKYNETHPEEPFLQKYEFSFLWLFL